MSLFRFNVIASFLIRNTFLANEATECIRSVGYLFDLRYEIKQMNNVHQYFIGLFSITIFTFTKTFQRHKIWCLEWQGYKQ